RDERTRAGRDDDGVARDQPAVADLDPPVPGELRATADERHAALPQPRDLDGDGQVVDDLVAPDEHRLHVEIPADRLARAAAAPAAAEGEGHQAGGSGRSNSVPERAESPLRAASAPAGIRPASDGGRGCGGSDQRLGESAWEPSRPEPSSGSKS